MPIPPEEFEPLPPDPYWTAWHEAGELPEKASGDAGYLYVVEFSTGVLKVGKTVTPRTRIRAHIHGAAPYGVQVTNMWVSEEHENADATEIQLIYSFSRSRVGPVGVEYFRMPFREAVQAAKRAIQHWA
jgi:hypothetical protein